jgi:tetratricopeptide (TPR) repeat protein
MNSRRQVTLFASLGLVIGLVASVLSVRQVDRIRPQAALDDVLYVSSPKLVRRASLGYGGLMACIYWTRAVQYFGHRHFDGAMGYNQLAPLLEITTNLDPHLVPAYEFGASFLAPRPPDGAGQPERAIQLMEYGIRNNPDDWHLYYDLGFIYYTELKQYAKAAEVFKRGVDVPNAHPFLRVLAAQMAQHAGEVETARMLWSATYQTSHDKDVRDNALEHLRALKVEADVDALEKIVAAFHQKTGRFPDSMAELAATAQLNGVPRDPDGIPYKLLPEGLVVVSHPDDFSFLVNGMPPGYKPPPPRFHQPK